MCIAEDIISSNTSKLSLPTDWYILFRRVDGEALLSLPRETRAIAKREASLPKVPYLVLDSLQPMVHGGTKLKKRHGRHHRHLLVLSREDSLEL